MVKLAQTTAMTNSPHHLELLNLVEYKKSCPMALTTMQRDALRSAVHGLTIEPVSRREGVYTVEPASTIGVVEVDGLSVHIQPKIGIPQVLSLALYAMGADDAWRRQFNFAEESALSDLLALALGRAAQQAFRRGLLHGYQTEEETLYGVRGRIRFDDQLRRRFGLELPVEVRYDDFTVDILENRLVKAATVRLAAMRLSPTARRGLVWTAGTLANVSPVEYPPNAVPEAHFNRLNEHYQEAVTLARLILRHSAYQSIPGSDVRAIGFLFNMNSIFQQFVAVALRKKLGASTEAFGERKVDSLDKDDKVELRPDLVWRQGIRVVFVGDAKYKDLSERGAREADLYQLLAYTTAVNLPSGLLVYAKNAPGVDQSTTYTVRHAGKQLEVVALDLAQPLDDVLHQVEGIAERVNALRRKAGSRLTA